MAEVEFSKDGQMRAAVGNARGKFADYRDIATLVLEVNGKLETYIAVTEYGPGCPPLEPHTVYKVTKA